MPFLFHKILVTGGAGFIGSHCVEALLAQGVEVVALDDFYDPATKVSNIAGIADRITLIKGDIRDNELVEKTFGDHQFDAVLHLAARAGVWPSISDPKLYFTTNIDGTFNLLDACRHHSVNRFIFASSSSVYGINEKVPFSENDRIERTISPYAATKIAGEQICSNYATSSASTAPASASSSFMVPISAQTSPLPSSPAPSGTEIQSTATAMAPPPKTTPILTTSSEVSSLGKPVVIRQLPEQPGHVPKTFVNVEKARRLLGRQSHTPILEGIRKYTAWLTAQVG